MSKLSLVSLTMMEVKTRRGPEPDLHQSSPANLTLITAQMQPETLGTESKKGWEPDLHQSSPANHTLVTIQMESWILRAVRKGAGTRPTPVITGKPYPDHSTLGSVRKGTGTRPTLVAAGKPHPNNMVESTNHVVMGHL